ncbi:hypothetical protein HYPSUDRAFT_1078639 [Hypholoma sublateritium FD-334 SS-4]|uniref:Uncharacterized protein n=1 Tax=Hypholoma sublateritium (strain FD-334 SS-4) TaxID=945553 RepID=A0A0D2PXA1_HYPSF|nr:hypothetical protein HYPSUDRAFT_1078639 [Hypholoma sublateritium FD-334 SS-4]
MERATSHPGRSSHSALRGAHALFRRTHAHTPRSSRTASSLSSRSPAPRRAGGRTIDFEPRIAVHASWLDTASINNRLDECSEGMHAAQLTISVASSPFPVGGGSAPANGVGRGAGIGARPLCQDMAHAFGALFECLCAPGRFLGAISPWGSARLARQVGGSIAACTARTTT